MALYEQFCPFDEFPVMTQHQDVVIVSDVGSADAFQVMVHRIQERYLMQLVDLRAEASSPLAERICIDFLLRPLVFAAVYDFIKKRQESLIRYPLSVHLFQFPVRRGRKILFHVQVHSVYRRVRFFPVESLEHFYHPSYGHVCSFSFLACDVIQEETSCQIFIHSVIAH